MTTRDTRRLLVGGYTDETAQESVPRGVVPFRHDRVDGTLTQDGPALDLDSPSYLVRHPTLPVVYAVNEVESAAVTAIAIDGPVRVMSTFAIPGELPCHLCISPDLRHLVIANYGDGTVVSIRLDADGLPGALAGTARTQGIGPHERQEGPHAHQALAGPDGAIWIVDLGTDLVRRLRIGADGTLEEVEPVVALPPGTGPRQIKLSHDPRTAYVLCELSGDLFTVALTPGRAGTIVDRRPAWLAAPTEKNLPAHLLVTDDRLYVSHRGLDRISEFDIASGRPDPVGELETGTWPRHFALEDGWFYVADQFDDRITARPLARFGRRRPSTPARSRAPT